MKKCLKSQIARKMQTKTMRHPLRWLLTKKLVKQQGDKDVDRAVGI